MRKQTTTKKKFRDRGPSTVVSSPVLALFEMMSTTVPAFKKYLADNHIHREDIRTEADLSNIPPTTKNNYLRAYPYHELFSHGSLLEPHILTSTSGSTGEPTFFARSYAVNEQSAIIHERFFLNSTLSNDTPTLVIICFGMGVWIGGLITYQAFEILGKKGYPLSIITPGINMNQILKILEKLAPNYPQLILVGYPPFVKDVLDAAQERGLPLHRHHVGIICAAEAFTEHFREYISKAAHIGDPKRDIMNIYGSADLGTMAFETPLSILVRQVAVGRPSLYAALFKGASKTPTLAQFIPSYTHFKEEAGQLLVSGNSAMPLIRYAIGDNGGVYTFKTLAAICAKHGIDITEEMKAVHMPSDDAALPFVYVYERSDLSTTLYGLQIYPETIKEVLLDAPFSLLVTGRITLITKYDDAHNQYLEINIEMRAGKEASNVFSRSLVAAIVQNLTSKNSEYRELANFRGGRATPRLVFWQHEDPLYFRRDIKQKWVVHEDTHSA